jgi:Rod binding domain-containing protein
MIQPNVDISTLTSQASISRLEALSRNRNQEKEVDRVAGEFQSMCYAHLVKSMFAATEDSALFGDSHAAGILRSMFIEAISMSGGAESLNIRASIKKNLYQTMGMENSPEVLNMPKKKEVVDVLL